MICSINAQNADLSLIKMYKIPSVKELIESTESGNHKFEVVSLFAGGGGSSTGYRMAGGKVLAINEFIPEARATYVANWPTTKIIPDDIREITPEFILDAIGKKKGELDILDGSPPCSAFSVAGRKNQLWGKEKAYSDSKQSRVEDLFFDYIRILRGMKPKVFIAENVAGLAQGVSKGYFNDIMRGLKDSGYYVEARVLDAKWLGVPQSRNRLIFIGVRNDLMKEGFKGGLHPEPLRKTVTQEEAFKGLLLTEGDQQETDMKRFATYQELIKLKPGEQSKKYFSLLKGHPKMASYCITATTGSIGAAGPKHWDNRAYTVSEIKRIMSVPDDYILTGTYQQQVERLGRMVAPFVMKEVANRILSTGVLNENSK